MVSKEKLVNTYAVEKSEPGKPYKPTEFDIRCSEIAAEYTEEELRGATVIRATYNRSKRQKKK